MGGHAIDGSGWVVGRLVVAAMVAGALALGFPAGTALALVSPPARPAPLGSFITDGPVASLAAGGGRVYLGGAFTRIGPLTGGAVELDPLRATRDVTFPTVSGTVLATVGDGAGGVYLGGAFTAVGGLPRANLAHVLASGLVDPGFAPQLDGQAITLALRGGELYVGGDFLHVGTSIRRRLAALRLPGGTLDPGFDPGVDGSVQDLALFGQRLYVDGRFTGISGQSRSGLAVIDLNTGNLAAGFDVTPDGPVDALLVLGDKLYIGGFFSQISGHSRAGLAAFDGATGTLDPTFSPSTNGQVYGLATDGTRVFAAGRFTEVARSFNNSVASLDPTTGSASQAFRFFADSDAYCLAIAGGRLYVGGEFTKVNDMPVGRLAAVDLSTGAVDPAFRPDPQNDVYALAFARAGELVAGGKFFSAPRLPAQGLAAVDAASGTALPGFLAGLGAKPGSQPAAAHALLLAGRELYVGGSFSSANGIPRANLAAFDTGTGELSPFAAGTDGPVQALALAGGRLYAGGSFFNADGRRHPGLAALDPVSGTVVPSFNLARIVRDRHHRKQLRFGLLQSQASVGSLLVADRRLYVGGSFNTVVSVGPPRARRTLANLVALDAGSGRPKRAFDPRLDGSVNSLVRAGRVLYAGGEFSSIVAYRRIHPKHGRPYRSPVIRSNVVQLRPANGTPSTRFRADTNGPVQTMALSASNLFLGGTFTTVNHRPRGALAAVDPSSGRNSITFTPDPIAYPRGSTGNSSGSSIPLLAALTIAGSRLYAGGNFVAFGLVPRLFLAAFTASP